MAAARQVFDTKTGRKKRIAGIVLLAVLLAACLAVVIAGFSIRYQPPELEPARQKGAPNVDEHYLYREVQTAFEHSFGIAANLYRQEDGSVNIWLVNPADSRVHLACEVKDAETNDVYYKSGRIEPGEYVQNLPPLILDNKQHMVDVTVYAFHETDFTSEGSTTLRLTLQPW